MELTTKGRYAVMAMADLAGQETDGTVALSAIAERHHLPLAYLEQLFVPLRRAGLVESARGRSGGYKLAKAASEISVADVMEAVEERTHFTRCADNDPRCSAATPCLTHGLWSALSDTTAKFLSSVSLADVAGPGRFGNARARLADSSSGQRTYLDYNATAPLCAEAKAAMIGAMEITGNPSSVHAEGRQARGVVEGARERVAKLVGAKPSEIVFTSGASEANAHVLSQRWPAILASGIEHDSVLAPARANGGEFLKLGCASDGVVRIDDIVDYAAKMKQGSRVLVAVQMANNETGVIQPVADIVAHARAHGFFVHTDAVQAAGRIAIDFAALGLDTLALSAHKLGGPKGIGALVIRDQLDLAPLLRGGGQERRRRAGTENVAAIAGFGAAAEVARANLKRMKEIAALRDGLESAICAISPRAIVIGRDAPRLANTSAIALPGKLAETLVIRLDLAGIAVSAGSACSSGKVGASHVLEAMGLGREIAGSTIRVSLGPSTTVADIDAFVAAWKTIAGEPALAA